MSESKDDVIEFVRLMNDFRELLTGDYVGIKSHRWGELAGKPNAYQALHQIEINGDWDMCAVLLPIIENLANEIKRIREVQMSEREIAAQRRKEENEYESHLHEVQS